MATYYVLPALTTWQSSNSTPNGFSSISGGTPIASANPGAADTVIFDQNSGPGRTIATTASCSVLTITSSAAGFALGQIDGSSSTITLNAASSITTLRFSGNNMTVICNGGYVANLTSNGGFTLTLGGPGNFGAISMGSAAFVTNSYDFTATAILASQTGGQFNWSLGTSNITINCSAPDSGSVIAWDQGNQASISGSPNVTFNITSSAISTALVTIGSAGATQNMVINSKVGTAAVYFPFSLNLASFTLRGSLSLASSVRVYASALVVDGNGCYGAVAKVSASGSAGIFQRKDSNVTYFDRMKATNISFVSDNSKAFYSRSDQGSTLNSGLNTIPGNSRFLTFL